MDSMRPSTPAKSLEQSIKEMRLIRAGELKGKKWDEYITEQKLDEIWQQAESNLEEMEREYWERKEG